MAFIFDTGYLYVKALVKMGYKGVAVTGNSKMTTQSDFEANVSLEDTEVYPSVDDVRAKAKEYATEQCWYDVRKLRDFELKESDYVSSLAAENGTEISDEWKAYRQGLRDITKQSDINNLVWPTHPEGKRVGFQKGYEPSNEF
tara:strand:- start:8 stop:436 length:429 start_codon:yes stop_codon:yes gene_type:complete